MMSDLHANTGRAGKPYALAAFVYHPGYYTVRLYRLAAWAYARGRIGRLFSMCVSRIAVLTTGCYLHPAARIGSGLYLPHPIGIVIGAGSVIGSGVTIYQHVTLGISGLGSETYPRLGDGVVVYSGAVIVGGISVGESAQVGANAVVVSDVPSRATAVGVPARWRLKLPAETE